MWQCTSWLHQSHSNVFSLVTCTSLAFRTQLYPLLYKYASLEIPLTSTRSQTYEDNNLHMLICLHNTQSRILRKKPCRSNWPKFCCTVIYTFGVKWEVSEYSLNLGVIQIKLNIRPKFCEGWPCLYLLFGKWLPLQIAFYTSHWGGDQLISKYMHTWPLESPTWDI